MVACGSNSSDKQEQKLDDNSLYVNYDYTSNTIEKGAEYSFGFDEWDMYVATAISDKLVRVVNWHKSSSDNPRFEEDDEIGVYRIDDPETGFIWIDDEHTAFYINIKDESREKLKKEQSVPFTPLTTSSGRDKGANYNEDKISYTYKRDKWYTYRAIPLTENIIKIESWICHYGMIFDKVLYGYDVNVINIENTITDFEWTDGEKTSFSLTMSDPKNGNYWDTDELVYFLIEDFNQRQEEQSAPEASDNIPEISESVLIPAPISSIDCEGQHYTEIVDLFTKSGFTNVEAIGHEIDYTEAVEDGSVVIVSIDDLSFEELEEFPINAKVLIGYRIIKPYEKGLVLPDPKSKLGIDLDLESESTIYYINVDGQINTPKLDSFDNVVVTDGVAEYFEHLEELGFIVNIVDSNTDEPYPGFSTYETTFKVYDGNSEWEMYLYIQDEQFLEYEFDIYLE